MNEQNQNKNPNQTPSQKQGQEPNKNQQQDAKDRLQNAERSKQADTRTNQS